MMRGAISMPPTGPRPIRPRCNTFMVFTQSRWGTRSKPSRTGREGALELSPKHLPALLSLADALLRENHEAEALPYATRAVEVEPTSWRAHVILANVYLRQGSADAAVKEAERAMELGHEQAAMVQPVLAGALARKGEKIGRASCRER